MPFLIFAFAFLVLPTLYLLSGSFQNLAAAPNDPAHGAFTLDNYAQLSTPNLADSYFASIEISLVTAVVGGHLRLPARLRGDHGRPAALPAIGAA